MIKGLDLSKFRKVDANRDHTVMENDEGHRIFLNHKAVSKEVHDALRNLPVQKLSKGGMVRKYAQGGPVVKVPGTDEKKKEVSAAFNAALGWKKMADGGMVGIQGEELSPADKGALAVTHGLVPAGGIPAEVGAELSTMSSQAQGEALAPAIRQDDMEMQAPPAKQEPQNFQLPQMQPVQEAPAQPPQQPSTLQQGVAQYGQGVQQEAQAQGAIAQESKGILDKQIEQQQMYEQKLQQNIAAKQKAYTDFSNYIANPANNINPQRYMQNQGTWGRISTAIGLGLGGAPAAEFLQKQIHEDVEAQKANVHNRNTLYAENMKLLGDEEAATRQTMIMMNQLVENQIKSATLKQGTQLAQANALKLGGVFTAQNAQHILQDAQMSAQKEILSSQPKSGDEYRRQIQAAEAVNPERADKLRARLTPAGFADTPDDAKEVKSLIADSNTARQTIKRLSDIEKTPLASLTPSLRAEAQSLVDRRRSRIAILDSLLNLWPKILQLSSP